MREYARSRRLLDQKRLPEVTVIGAGHIGSSVVFALSRLGVGQTSGRILVYDGDRVKEENIGPSIVFDPDDIEWRKAMVLKQKLGVQAYSWYQDEYIETEVVISAVDSMSERRRIWRAIQPYDVWELYIDARVGASTTEIYCVRREDWDAVEMYEKSLFNEPTPAPCGTRGISYNAFGVAGDVSAIVRAYAMDKPFPTYIYRNRELWVNLVLGPRGNSFESELSRLVGCGGEEREDSRLSRTAGEKPWKGQEGSGDRDPQPNEAPHEEAVPMDANTITF